jgi:hypothetical protein
LKEIPVESPASSEKPLWLFSRRADFWLACGGASLGVLAAVFVILWHGDRELDAVDFVLSEFHLGATYDAVIRRRLWRRRPIDVLLMPLGILALTYALSMSGQAVLLTTITMYAAVWHRGRQSFGVARFYQRQVGGPVSRTHDFLFRGAVYLPMLAALLAYTHFASVDFEGKPYLALTLGAEMTLLAALGATVCVIAYLVCTLGRSRRNRLNAPNHTHNLLIHPGEWWVVVANAAAFGSAYALGASNASFLLVLAVHHEIQYLYFTYAMARRTSPLHVKSGKASAATKGLDSEASSYERRGLVTEAKFAASFLLWPVIGFTGAIVGAWSELRWLAPLGIGGLYCHYWLDGRIWTRRSF